MGDEARKGSLEVGKFADMIVLSKDITKTPPEHIDAITVVETWVDGKLVFSRERSDAITPTI
jgi:predicted amidohydrolase YtcJ